MPDGRRSRCSDQATVLRYRQEGRSCWPLPGRVNIDAGKLQDAVCITVQRCIHHAIPVVNINVCAVLNSAGFVVCGPCAGVGPCRSRAYPLGGVVSARFGNVHQNSGSPVTCIFHCPAELTDITGTSRMRVVFNAWHRRIPVDGLSCKNHRS